MGMCININHNDYNGHINHRETFGGIFGTWFEWFIMVLIFPPKLSIWFTKIMAE